MKSRTGTEGAYYIASRIQPRHVDDGRLGRFRNEQYETLSVCGRVQTYSQADRQTSIHTDMNAKIHTDGQAVIHIDRQTSIHTTHEY